jgi:hypothetical protein
MKGVWLSEPVCVLCPCVDAPLCLCVRLSYLDVEVTCRTEHIWMHRRRRRTRRQHRKAKLVAHEPTERKVHRSAAGALHFCRC